MYRPPPSSTLTDTLCPDTTLCRPRAKALAADTLAAVGEVIDTTPAILSKLSGKDNPQTVVGIYAEPQTTLADLERDAAPIWLVAERLRDPGNLGTMLRTGDAVGAGGLIPLDRSEEHPSELQSLMRISYAVFCLKKKKQKQIPQQST